MSIRTAQDTLDKYYAVRDNLLAGKIQSYTIGDKTISLVNMKELDRIIQYWEAAVTANEPIVADMRYTGAGQDFTPYGINGRGMY